MKDFLYAIFIFLGIYFIINSVFSFGLFVYENFEFCADKLTLFTNFFSSHPIFFIIIISFLVFACFKCIINMMME